MYESAVPLAWPTAKDSSTVPEAMGILEGRKFVGTRTKSHASHTSNNFFENLLITWINNNTYSINW